MNCTTGLISPVGVFASNVSQRMLQHSKSKWNSSPNHYCYPRHIRGRSTHQPTSSRSLHCYRSVQQTQTQVCRYPGKALSTKFPLGNKCKFTSPRRFKSTTTTTTTATSKTTKTASNVKTSPSSSSWAPFWRNEFPLLNKPRKMLFGMSLSEACGNISSILTLMAYLMTDMMELRITAICATLLSITFQYYRTTPLWIPIRWNVVLLILNATMVTTLYLERRRAQQMSPPLETLYDKGSFGTRGFSKVEFLRLHDLATPVTLPPGHVLVRQGEAKEALYFLVEGSVHITKKEQPKVVIAHLGPFHFLGEISLLSRMASAAAAAASAASGGQTSTVVSDPPPWDSAASANVVVSSKEPATFLEWKFDDLVPYLRGDREVRNALSAFINYDLTSKLLRDGAIHKLQRSTSISAQPVVASDKDNGSRKAQSSTET